MTGTLVPPEKTTRTFGIVRRALRVWWRAWTPFTILTLVLANPVSAQRGAHTAPPNLVSTRLALADSAFAAENYQIAEREYLKVLAFEPWNSRATYRLAELRRDAPSEQLRLFQRYVELEPLDPWGYIAVGNTYARQGEYRRALRWFDQAQELAPGERDVHLGRARILARARYTDAAIHAYRRWIDFAPSDVEAWRELSRELQRAGRFTEAIDATAQTSGPMPEPGTVKRLRHLRWLAAPRIIPVAGGARDSDGIETTRMGLSGDVFVSKNARFGIAGVRTRVSEAARFATADAFDLAASWRPRATIHISTSVGLVRASPQSAATGASVLPTFRLRTRWRAPGDGTAAELVISRSLLSASPLLVANRNVTEDGRTRIDVPLTRGIRLRATGRLTRVANVNETNWRRGLGTIVVFQAVTGVELSAQFHHATFKNPTSSGYFAPRIIQSVEAGSYMEFYPHWMSLVAIDLGLGIQRTAKHGQNVTGWEPSIRFWSEVWIPIVSGVELGIELEAYQARIGDINTATATGWRYGSVTTSLRVPVR